MLFWWEKELPLPPFLSANRVVVGGVCFSSWRADGPPCRVAWCFLALVVGPGRNLDCCAAAVGNADGYGHVCTYRTSMLQGISCKGHLENWLSVGPFLRANLGQLSSSLHPCVSNKRLTTAWNSAACLWDIFANNCPF